MKIQDKHLFARTACIHRNLADILPADCGFSPVERAYNVAQGNLQYSFRCALFPESQITNILLNEDQPLIGNKYDNFLFIAISNSEDSNRKAFEDFQRWTNIRFSEEYASIVEKVSASEFIPVFDFLKDIPAGHVLNFNTK